MKYKKITSLSVDEDKIQVFEGRTATFEKCAVAYFAGPEGWGVTMNIRIEELESFVNKPHWQKRFVVFAKEKLGMEYESI
ncbi:hypothetical protein [Vibrio parahaemolyticus]|uniref:hypothetical protein n=1 Tax=Vibrio parahaemolyticus TaxID=670 RepID=UPI0003F8E531|nr:hypothetical protein [Vibrio parahaemolyticus]EIU6868814.1 hypothetical protein [Vibrio parahaemolyticus]MDF4586025.1 hypothetical protein [Vibrio parahaemolyticus]MDF4713954.1 hypothetical protein [Vibrio parahaemolyticus]TOL65017.1 hypothetical protein CGH94_16875 [Vibrio parahaemolyticus]HCE4620346.1 hypothetical protein [Vibrio parahaemolyticus]